MATLKLAQEALLLALKNHIGFVFLSKLGAERTRRGRRPCTLNHRLSRNFKACRVCVRNRSTSLTTLRSQLRSLNGQQNDAKHLK